MRIPRLLGAALTVPLLIGGLLVATAGPAAACTYPVPPSEATSAARADAVFVGMLVSQVNQSDRAAAAAREELAREVQRRPPRRQRVDEPARKVAQSSDRAVLTFEVRRVYKGRVGRRQEVVTSWHPSCPPPLVTGPGPFLIFANNPSPAVSSRYQLGPGQYTLSLGSRALTDGGEPDLGRPGGGWPQTALWLASPSWPRESRQDWPWPPAELDAVPAPTNHRVEDSRPLPAISAWLQGTSTAPSPGLTYRGTILSNRYSAPSAHAGGA